MAFALGANGWRAGVWLESGISTPPPLAPTRSLPVFFRRLRRALVCRTERTCSQCISKQVWVPLFYSWRARFAGGEARSGSTRRVLTPGVLPGADCFGLRSLEPAHRFAPQPWAPGFPTGFSAAAYPHVCSPACLPAASTVLRRARDPAAGVAGRPDGPGEGSPEPVSPVPLTSVAVLGGCWFVPGSSTSRLGYEAVGLNMRPFDIRHPSRDAEPGSKIRARLLYTHAEPILSHAFGRIITRFTRFTRFRPICLWIKEAVQNLLLPREYKIEPTALTA